MTSRRGAAARERSVTVENLGEVSFEFSQNGHRLKVRLPDGSDAVVVDLSRAAVLDLVDKLSARATGMAEPEAPVQQTGSLPALLPEVARWRR